jgi:hypothetical protein
MDLGLVAGVVMLVGWAIATFVFNGPGWVHLFLSLGVFLVIWRFAARSVKSAPDAPAPRSGSPPSGRRRSKTPTGQRSQSPTGVPLFRGRKP